MNLRRIQRSRIGQNAIRNVRRYVRRHGIESADASAFKRGVVDDGVVVDHPAEVDHAEHQEDENRHYQSEFDRLGPPFAGAHLAAEAPVHDVLSSVNHTYQPWLTGSASRREPLARIKSKSARARPNSARTTTAR